MVLFWEPELARQSRSTLAGRTGNSTAPGRQRERVFTEIWTGSFRSKLTVFCGGIVGSSSRVTRLISEESGRLRGLASSWRSGDCGWEGGGGGGRTAQAQ